MYRPVLVSLLYVPLIYLKLLSYIGLLYLSVHIQVSLSGALLYPSLVVSVVCTLNQ